jgi:hypothetical protein
MRRISKRALVVAGGVLTASVVLATSAGGFNVLTLTPVPGANTRSDGYAPASLLSPELRQYAVAQGSTRIENPSSAVAYYGYDNDVVNSAGQPQMVPTPTVPTNEAHKTEPDKNVYLVFSKGLKGPSRNYDYGRRFLFQGHEGGSPGYITRINLDADAAHRVTLYPTQDDNGVALSTIDGVTSSWQATQSAHAPPDAKRSMRAARDDILRIDPSSLSRLHGNCNRRADSAAGAF